MPINYSVQADVIDLRSYTPQASDQFFVDTNVWYWLTYPPASSSAQPYQTNYYPTFVNDSIFIGASLYCSGLSLAELAHLIEKSEYQLSSYSNLRIKEFRHNYPLEHARVHSQVQGVWGQVENLASQISCTVGPSTVNSALTRLQTQALDGYDLFILESMQQNSITQVVTDDGDYVTVPGIQVFTANQGAITAAQNQGKLIV